MKQKGWKYRQRFEILTIVLQLCDKQRIQNPLQFAHEKSSYGGSKFGRFVEGPPIIMNLCLYYQGMWYIKSYVYLDAIYEYSCIGELPCTVADTQFQKSAWIRNIALELCQKQHIKNPLKSNHKKLIYRGPYFADVEVTMNPVLNNKCMCYFDLYTFIWIIITNIKELNKLRNYLY